MRQLEHRRQPRRVGTRCGTVCIRSSGHVPLALLLDENEFLSS
jgi:hypothetical protein